MPQAGIAASPALSANVLGQSISDSIADTSELPDRRGRDNNGRGAGFGGGNGGGQAKGPGVDVVTAASGRSGAPLR